MSPDGLHYVDGGPDTDRVSFQKRKQGVDLDLGNTDLARGDVIINVEIFQFSDHSDRVTDSNSGRTYFLGKGNDNIELTGADNTVLAPNSGRNSRITITFGSGTNRAVIDSGGQQGSRKVIGGTGDDTVVLYDVIHTPRYFYFHGNQGTDRLVVRRQKSYQTHYQLCHLCDPENDYWFAPASERETCCDEDNPFIGFTVNLLDETITAPAHDSLNCLKKIYFDNPPRANGYGFQVPWKAALEFTFRVRVNGEVVTVKKQQDFRTETTWHWKQSWL